MFNYAAWLQAKLDDPSTSTSDYLKYWNELRAHHQQQGHLNFLASQRQSRIEPAVAK